MMKRWTRKLHRWVAIIFFAPLVFIISTGLLLQLKKQIAWIQPPTMKGRGSPPQIALEQILEIARSQPRATITGWEDIDRLDLRPAAGIVKVQAKNRWEIQLDLQTGDVLASTYRRSDLIESLHDGSFFGEWSKLGIFLPAGAALLLLWLSGLYLWYLPFGVRARKRRKYGRPVHAHR